VGSCDSEFVGRSGYNGGFRVVNKFQDFVRSFGTVVLDFGTVGRDFGAVGHGFGAVARNFGTVVRGFESNLPRVCSTGREFPLVGDNFGMGNSVERVARKTDAAALAHAETAARYSENFAIGAPIDS